MQGRKAQKNASKTRITDPGELDVEESELSIAKKEGRGRMFVHESDSGGWNAFSAMLLDKEFVFERL